MVEVEDGFELFRCVRRNAVWIVFGNARNLLQLDAPAFDRVATDDGTRVGEEYDAAMNEDDRQQQCHKIGFPTFSIVDERQDQGEENDVPRVFRTDEHHTARDGECHYRAFAQTSRLAVDGGQRFDVRHMQFVPHAEPPYECESEQRRFRQGNRGEHRKRAHHEEQKYHESGFRTGPQSGGACHDARFGMRVIAHIPAIVAFRVGEVECADAEPAPRQVEESVGGRRTAECGEQPLQCGKHHNARIVGVGEIAGNRRHRAVEHGEHNVMLIGQVCGIIRPHVMRGRVDIHGYEREEADIRLLQTHPLVQRPAEFADLRTYIGAECGQ